MIPKPLNEIEWSDIEALRDSGREEDDTIEYKGGFSGGSDFLAFNDNQQKTAVDGIAKEALAFLNGRGGDIVIGVSEYKNDHPKIEKITPLNNVIATADRLAQSLSALIEPAQTVLTVRAIRLSDGTSDGLLIVRCPASLRAPHRSKRTKECYIRRGRESVPMPMDEVQDVTIRRADLRRERLQFLEVQFEDLDTERVGRSSLSAHRFHIRSVFVPFEEQQIEIDDVLCSALRGSDPSLVRFEKSEQISVPFRDISFSWQPVLRGKRLETLTEQAWGKEDFIFCAKEVRSSGMLMSDFACRVSIDGNSASLTGFYHEWIAGYLANTLYSFRNVWKQKPELGQGVLRIAIRSAGSIISVVNEGTFSKRHIEWPRGVDVLPDFPISDGDDFLSIFKQSQIDAASVIGFDLKNPFEFADT